MNRLTVPVIGTEIDVLSWEEAKARIVFWASRGESRVVAICNAHSLVHAQADPSFAGALASADMRTPDGFPVAFMMRMLGYRDQQRISGPDLMWASCQDAQQAGLPVYFYGGSPEVLNELIIKLKIGFPRLNIAGWYSPPFRALTTDEDQAVVRMINESGARIVWVGLGCPKQEIWMRDHSSRISSVMVGVGAAFDFHAGTLKRAPSWMQRAGVEWLHRLAQEPRRLWRRYLYTNTAFVLQATRQIMKSRSRR